MIDWDLIKRLMACFPRSIINSQGEFIAHIKANEYFRLTDCETELDIKCKVLEWLSGSYKRQPYGRADKNREFHKFMRDGINEFLGTQFTEDDLDQIYTYLGNRCNHQKTLKFIASEYNLSVLNTSPDVENIDDALKGCCISCKACVKGFFKSQPDAYVCTGVRHPFIVDNVYAKCKAWRET